MTAMQLLVTEVYKTRKIYKDLVVGDDEKKKRLESFAKDELGDAELGRRASVARYLSKETLLWNRAIDRMQRVSLLFPFMWAIYVALIARAAFQATMVVL